MTRLNYIDLLLAGSRNARVGRYKPLDIQSIVDANHIDTPERFVDYFASYLLDGVLDHERRQQLIDYFTTSDTTGQNGVQITLSGGKRYPLSRVRGTLYLMLAAPEFQLN